MKEVEAMRETHFVAILSSNVDQELECITLHAMMGFRIVQEAVAIEAKTLK